MTEYKSMASTLVKIDVHLIFHVKSTGTRMRTEDLERIFPYIGGIIKGIGGLPISVGGMPDHIHILTSFPKTMSLVEFVKNVKADSSKWMKSLDAYYGKFAWQEGYGAFSVSPSLVDKTIHYIRKGPSKRNTNCFLMRMVFNTMSGMRLEIRCILVCRPFRTKTWGMVRSLTGVPLRSTACLCSRRPFRTLTGRDS